MSQSPPAWTSKTLGRVVLDSLIAHAVLVALGLLLIYLIVIASSQEKTMLLDGAPNSGMFSGRVIFGNLVKASSGIEAHLSWIYTFAITSQIAFYALLAGSDLQRIPGDNHRLRRQLSGCSDIVSSTVVIVTLLYSAEVFHSDDGQGALVAGGMITLIVIALATTIAKFTIKPASDLQRSISSALDRQTKLQERARNGAGLHHHYGWCIRWLQDWPSGLFGLCIPFRSCLLGK